MSEDLEARVTSPLEAAPRPGSDVSFEVDLDDPDDQPQRRKPVYVDVVSEDHELLPVFPAAFRSLEGVKSTVKRFVARQAHIAGHHMVRMPFWYLPAAAWYSLVGVGKLAGRLIGWWWDFRSLALEQAAVNSDDRQDFHKARAEGNARRAFRGSILLGGLVVTLIVLAFVRTYAPWWVRVLLVVAAIPPLARLGRPSNKPIIRSAVVAPRFRKLNSDIVLRAYYAAGLGHPDKPGQQVGFLSQMARDNRGMGSQVQVALPYGKTFADDVVPARSKIASGLDVTSNQVFLTRDKTSDRSHTLYVADRDPLAIPAGRTPLLDCRPRDIWKAAPFGLDERGRKVEILLLWISMLVGAQPRKGKTFAARLLALYAALDPYVKLTVVDGKDAPDWKDFRLVAHRLIMGTVPNRDGDPIEMLLDALREIKKHIQDVNKFLSTLPVSECPEGKLTRELSRKYPQLRVWLLVMEEFQVYYELDDQDTNKEIAGLLSFIMAVGPSAGVILLSSSQKPSGVGSGDVQRLFNRYRDNHAVRFALKCGNRLVSEAVLGGDAYSEGFDASSLPIGPEYRGVGYLYGLSDETPTVRTYLADQEDAQRILTAARRHREAADTLTGMAAGEDMTREFRDVLRDVRDVFYAGEAWVSWKELAERLAEQMPEHYADITQEAISAQVRALGVDAKKGKQNGASLWGVPRDRIEQGIKRREIAAGL